MMRGTVALESAQKLARKFRAETAVFQFPILQTASADRAILSPDQRIVTMAPLAFEPVRLGLRVHSIAPIRRQLLSELRIVCRPEDGARITINSTRTDHFVPPEIVILSVEFPAYLPMQHRPEPGNGGEAGEMRSACYTSSTPPAVTRFGSFRRNFYIIMFIARERIVLNMARRKRQPPAIELMPGLRDLRNATTNPVFRIRQEFEQSGCELRRHVRFGRVISHLIQAPPSPTIHGPHVHCLSHPIGGVKAPVHKISGTHAVD